MDELVFEAVILRNGDMDAAYIEVPYDIYELFGKRRLLVNATFDGVKYQGQVVRMGTSCYIIGVPKQIRQQINKSFGDCIKVSIRERDALKCQSKANDKPKTIKEYIAAVDSGKTADLMRMYDIIKTTLVDAQEKIVWAIPTFYKRQNICHFAAAKNHIGFYPGPDAIEFFKPLLTGYQVSKGVIRIPYGKIDESLIVTIVKWCGERERNNNDESKNL